MTATVGEFTCPGCGNNRSHPHAPGCINNGGGGRDSPTLVEQLRGRLMTTAELQALPPPVPLIAGYLYLDSLAMIYGSSGGGKSHVAIDIASTVTARPTWNSHPVTPGSVLYVVAEGVSGVGIRTKAWDQYHGVEGQVTWYPEAINIYSPTWASALADVVAAERYSLVVLDTFARSIPGADENSARDVGQAIAHLDMVRRAAGSCVLLVHHAGKDRTAGARGSSALRGAMTTELELDGDGDRLTLHNRKQKDAPESASLHLRLHPVDGSVVLVQAAHVDSPAEVPASVLETHAALRFIDVAGGVSATTWLKACDITERTFYRHRSALLQRGYVVNVGTDKQARYRPCNLENTEDSDD